MAELSPEVAAKIVGVFLAEYNARHQSTYELRSLEPPDDSSCDYLCLEPRQSGTPLKIQLTRAAAVVETSSPDSLPEPGVATRSLHAWLKNKKARELPSVVYETPADSAVRAVESKVRKLGPSSADLVLVIFFNLMRFDDDVDLPEMIAAVAKLAVPFREVWALWSFVDDPGAARLIWPAQSGRGSSV